MVRRQWIRLAMIAVVLASALVGCVGAAPVTPPADATSSAPPARSASPTFAPRIERPAPEPEATISPLRLVSATVVRVVDGDTAVMRLASGRVERVRFIGVDTPESTIEHQPYGKEASRYTTERLTGRRVFLQVGVESRDRYGRLLAYVWLARPTSLSDTELRTKLFDAQLLIQGYAQLLTIPPNVDYVESFRRYQAEAREHDRGLWGLATSSSAPRKSSASGYVGSARSDKFHYPSCVWAKRIAPDNLVRFATRAAAVKAGYVPCKVCDP